MKKLITLAAVALALTWSSMALACQCKDTRDRDESFRMATYVFFGEVVDDDGSLALKVKENFKGTKAKRTHAIAAGDCAFGFEKGKTYMVFADKGKKREIVVDRCNATAQLDHAPLTYTIWTIADELAYKTSKSAADEHERARDTISGRAEKKLKGAARACDAEVWKGKDEMKARMEVRFDVQPDGKYEVSLLRYETPGADAAVTKCLTEKLGEDDFAKFPGGPVSVVVYWVIDRLDASFGEDRSSSAIVPFKSDKRFLE